VEKVEGDTEKKKTF